MAVLLAELDVSAALAQTALLHDWCLPEIADSQRELQLRGLRHPVVERNIDGRYIPNDVDMDQSRHMSILTGPNCGGKSTYIRSVGIAVLLNQIGSYVPATRYTPFCDFHFLVVPSTHFSVLFICSAKLPVFDRILARIGASDSQVSYCRSS
jgi:DNA mismatch repair protein MutS